MKKTTIIIILFLLSCRYDGARKHIKNEEIKGIIIDIFQEKNNHNMYTFMIETESDTIKKGVEVWPKSWEYAEIGDSIIKPKDTLMIIIKKPTKKYKKFFYDF